MPAHVEALLLVPVVAQMKTMTTTFPRSAESLDAWDRYSGRIRESLRLSRQTQPRFGTNAVLFILRRTSCCGAAAAAATELLRLLPPLLHHNSGSADPCLLNPQTLNQCPHPRNPVPSTIDILKCEPKTQNPKHSTRNRATDSRVQHHAMLSRCAPFAPQESSVAIAETGQSR